MQSSPPSFFIEMVPLGNHCTFHIGGAARWLAPVHTLEEMQAALAFCHRYRQPFFILGKGSNCLFDDKGFHGVVIVNKLTSCEALEPGIWRLGGGYSFARLGTITAKSGWSGLEFAAGIPGTVGGAVYMNAGVQNNETANTLVEVDILHPDGTKETLPSERLSFGYRSSPFQKRHCLITGATFSLNACVEAKEKQKALLAYRTASQPYGEPSAGCIFRNPPGISAGAIVEECGLKGYTVGGAMVSHKHANFIVNRGGATAGDVLTLIEMIRTVVFDKRGITLEKEVCYISPEGERL